MQEDLELLRRVIEEPVRQMILVGVSSNSQAQSIASLMREWSDSVRPVAELPFNANDLAPGVLMKQAQNTVGAWDNMDDDPGLLILRDTSPPNARNDTTAAFWRGMNLLRERWDSLPTQTVFLVTPEQYRLLTTEADHLNRWVTLKVDLRGTIEPVPPRTRGGVSSFLDRVDSPRGDLDDKPAAQRYQDILQDQLQEALERGEPPALLTSRYYLPVLANAITLDNWDEAIRVDGLIAQCPLTVNNHLRWLRLHFHLYAETRQGPEVHEAAARWLEFATQQGTTRDVLGVLWDLIWFNIRQNNLDEAEMLYKEALEIEPLSAVFLSGYAIFLTDVRHDHEQAEAFFGRSLEADPTHGPNLGNYAFFLHNVRQNYDKAEELYQRAVEADSNDATTRSNYAIFLEKVRHDYSKAEELYQSALQAHSDHAFSLGRYALFLEEVRHDYGKAEELYQRAVEAGPTDATVLGNYAIFLKTIHHDYDKADEFYQRALQANPDNVYNLGSYALFLDKVRHDFDKAQEFHQRAVKGDPANAALLSNYAIFLKTVLHDYDKAEELYRRALDADPKDTSYLGNYANFISDVRQDPERAEEIYRRALQYESNSADILGDYATFVYEVRHDPHRAEELYRRAVEADPDDAYTIVNYAQLLLAQGRRVEGAALLERIWDDEDSSQALQAEVNFYRYAHQLDNPSVALTKLKKVLEAGGRSPGWNLEPNIARARLDGHPNIPLLKALAAVITEGEPLESLEAFPEWREAGSSVDALPDATPLA